MSTSKIGFEHPENISSDTPIVNTDRANQVALERWERVRSMRHLLAGITMQVTFRTKQAMHGYKLNLYYGINSKHVDEEQQNFRSKYIIYPWDRGAIIWDLIVSILKIYFCFTIPYRICYLSADKNSELIVYELIFDIFLLIDIIVSFFRAYIEDVDIVDNPWKIAKQYLTSTFIIDVAATPPFYLLESSLMWLKFGRILGLGRLTSWLENSAVMSRFNNKQATMDWSLQKNMGRMFRFFLYFSIIAHFIACFWYLIGVEQDEPKDETWLSGVDQSNTENYILSLYWTITTFSTVGYGDYSAASNGEMAYSMVVEIVGILFFAYLTGTVTSVILNKRKLDIIQRQNDIDKWLMLLDKNRPEKRISSALYIKIRNFFDYIHFNDHSYLINDSDFLMQLPPSIRQELLEHLFRDEIKSFSAFFKGCPDHFSFWVILNMFPMKFKPFVEIIQAGDQIEYMYFIRQGSVVLSTKFGIQKFLRLAQGSFFGETNIVFSIPAEFSYISGSQGCECFRIRADTFKGLLEFYPIAKRTVQIKSYKRYKYFRAAYAAYVKGNDNLVSQQSADENQQDNERQMSGFSGTRSGLITRQKSFLINPEDAANLLVELREGFKDLYEDEEQELQFLTQEDQKQPSEVNDIEQSQNTAQILNQLASKDAQVKFLRGQITEIMKDYRELKEKYQKDVESIEEFIRSNSRQ